MSMCLYPHISFFTYAVLALILTLIIPAGLILIFLYASHLLTVEFRFIPFYIRNNDEYRKGLAWEHRYSDSTVCEVGVL